MRELALFAGAGGGILGARMVGCRVVCAVELDPYCREILLRRQEEGYLDPFPIWDDVRTFKGRPWRGAVDIVTAGFPCQPHSYAGKRLGAEDDRNLWPDTIRVVQEVSPHEILLENVPGILDYLPVVIRDLRRAGYTVERPTIVAAAHVGAGHIRKRIWIRAHRACSGRQGQPRKAPRRWEIEAQPRPGTGYGISSNRAGDGERQPLEVIQTRQSQSGDDPVGSIPANHDSQRIQQCEGCWREEQGRNRDGSSKAVSSDRDRSGLPIWQGQREDVHEEFTTSERNPHDERNREVPPDTDGIRLGIEQGRGEEDRSTPTKHPDDPEALRSEYWNTEPGLARLVRRPAYRVDRIRATGNIQVPAVVHAAWAVLKNRG